MSKEREKLNLLMNLVDGCAGEHYRQYSGHMYIGKEFLQETIKRYKERGYDIVLKWKQ